MKRGRYIGYFVSGALVVFIAATFDWRRVAAELGRFSYVYLLPAVILYLFGFWVRAVRWRCMLSPLKKIGLKNSFIVVMIGFMANNILPLRMGEFVRAWALKRKEGVSGSAGFATIVLERIYDGLTLVGLLVFALLFSETSRLIKIYGAVGALIFLCAYGLLLYAAFRPESAGRLSLKLTGLLPERLRPRGESLVASFLSGLQFMSSGRSRSLVMLYSVCVWLIEGGVFWLVMLGIHLEVPAYAALFTLAIVNIVIMVPAMPGYVGTFDYAAVLALAPFGVGRDLAMSYIIIVHSLQYVTVTGLGLYYMNASGWTLKEIEGAERK